MAVAASSESVPASPFVVIMIDPTDFKLGATTAIASGSELAPGLMFDDFLPIPDAAESVPAAFLTFGIKATTESCVPVVLPPVKRASAR